MDRLQQKSVKKVHTQTASTTNSTFVGKKRPPVRIDISYGLVTLGSTAIWSVLSGWLLYFYLPPEGTPLVPATFYSLVIFITSTIHVIIDPTIGYLSDHTRSQWGRRLPFMFASALPTLVFFVLLWTPPVQVESAWNLAYLKVLRYLRRTQTMRSFWPDKWHTSPYYPTCHAVIACAGYDGDLVDGAVHWILETQNANGSWDYYTLMPVLPGAGGAFGNLERPDVGGAGVMR